MPKQSTKPVIFISYSHKDEPEEPRSDEVAWLIYVQSFLAPAVKNGVFELWVDEQIKGGGDWQRDIKKKLAACDVFVLLASRHSLASDYVVDIEINAIRERQKKGEKVQFYPIILTPCPKAALEPIKIFNIRPKGARPLSGYDQHERDTHMAKIADEIAKLVATIAEIKAKRAAKPPPSVPGFVDIDHLPDTPYEALVGRDGDLASLDQAWKDENTSIMSLIAQGGAGKSALVNEWLARLQKGNYRGAEAVLGWSFYSQGTKERATSAEQFLNWAVDKLGLTVASTSASAKGGAIADALAKRRVLLLLDGLEPLQHGPGPQQGELKDQGLHTLLRRVAALPSGARRSLVVLTSRLAVKDIDK